MAAARLTFCCLLLFIPTLASAQDEADEARFAYTGPSSLAGRFRGECAAAGVTFPPGELELEADAATLEVSYTRVNYTRTTDDLGRVPVRRPDRQWTETGHLPPGRFRVTWGSDGVATLLPASGRTDLLVELDLAQATTSSPAYAPAAPAGFHWAPGDDGTPAVEAAQFAGWSRPTTFQGHAQAHDDVTLLLRQAHLDWNGGARDLPPWITQEQNLTTAVVAVETLLFTEAFLYLSNATAVLPPDAAIHCGDRIGRLEGSFVADAASGSVEGAGEPVTFGRRVVSIEGTFQLEERVPQTQDDPPAITSSAFGSIQIVGVDFQPVRLELGLEQVAAVTSILALLTTVAVFAWKSAGNLVGAFYSRFGRDDALTNGNRDVIYQAIVTNPGIDLLRLHTLTPLHLSTVAYHVRVLRRVGLVERLTHGHSQRLIPRDAPVDRVDIVAKYDEKMAFVREQVRQGPAKLGDVVAAIRQRFPMTRQAAHFMVRRAIERKVVLRQGTGRGTVLRCA